MQREPIIRFGIYVFTAVVLLFCVATCYHACTSSADYTVIASDTAYDHVHANTGDHVPNEKSTTPPADLAAAIEGGRLLTGRGQASPVPRSVTLPPLQGAWLPAGGTVKRDTNRVTVYDTVRIRVDSAAIVQGYLDWLNTREYDTIYETKYGPVHLSERLQYNRVATRSVTANFKIPVVTNTVQLPAPKPKRWGIGLQVGYGYQLGAQPAPYVGVGLSRNLIRF
ncbi:DUF6808 domain-containing protein [Flaviaesturariibacter amylovorans]|uniref:DUF6808 domain-containing protein n=1 Tax=Flaviaesturariibacter amylovorans TaxID=1084520 RepID=A0ABP8GQY3_9BACT